MNMEFEVFYLNLACFLTPGSKFTAKILRNIVSKRPYLSGIFWNSSTIRFTSSGVARNTLSDCLERFLFFFFCLGRARDQRESEQAKKTQSHYQEWKKTWWQCRDGNRSTEHIQVSWKYPRISDQSAHSRGIILDTCFRGSTRVGANLT